MADHEAISQATGVPVFFSEPGIVTWIERTYHRRRRQDTLGRLTPVEFENTMTTPATQAA